MRCFILLLSSVLLACGGQKRDPEPPPPLQPLEPVPPRITITGAGGTTLMGTVTGEPAVAPVAVAQTAEAEGRMTSTSSGGNPAVANSEPRLPHRDTTNVVTGTSMVTVTTSVTSAGSAPRIY